MRGVSKITSLFSFFNKYASKKDDINHIATIMYVSLPKKPDGPSAPNIEFEDPPPNADPRSEPLPC